MDLASNVDRGPSTSSYHHSRPEAEGLIDKERDGQRVRIRLIPKARQGLAQTRVAD